MPLGTVFHDVSKGNFNPKLHFEGKVILKKWH